MISEESRGRALGTTATVEKECKSLYELTLLPSPAPCYPRFLNFPPFPASTSSPSFDETPAAAATLYTWALILYDFYWESSRARLIYHRCQAINKYKKKKFA